MKPVAIFYPGGVRNHPTTGGQVYDYRLFNILAKNDVPIQYFDDKKINRKDGESILKLPLRIISKLRSLGKHKVILFNTALFPYYLFPFAILKLFYPYIQLVGIHHHFRFQEQKGLRRKIYKFLEFLHLKQCSYVINPCPYTRDVLLKFWPKGRIINLENAFVVKQNDISKYKRYNLLYVGSVYERKGIIYLLEALSLIPDQARSKISLDIVGNIDENSEYSRLLFKFVEDKNLNHTIKFRGRVSEQELEEYYKNAYAFVLPSLLEGYGLVIIEAMSYGLPVIAFNNSAMPYTIKHGENGLIAENMNPESLCNNILLLINDSKLHEKLANNAMKTSATAYSVEQFEVDAREMLKSLDII